MSYKFFIILMVGIGFIFSLSAFILYTPHLCFGSVFNLIVMLGDAFFIGYVLGNEK